MCILWYFMGILYQNRLLLSIKQINIKSLDEYLAHSKQSDCAVITLSPFILPHTLICSFFFTFISCLRVSVTKVVFISSILFLPHPLRLSLWSSNKHCFSKFVLIPYPIFLFSFTLSCSLLSWFTNIPHLPLFLSLQKLCPDTNREWAKLL